LKKQPKQTLKMPVNKPANVDLSKITLSEPKKFGNNGAAMSYVNYDGIMNPLYVQTPKVILTFDAKYYADNDTSGKYGVVFSLPTNDSDPDMKSFIDKMNELDQHVIDVAFEQRALWFKNGKKLTRETIETEKHTPLIKVYTDPETGESTGKFAPTFKFKIVKKDDKHDCSVYDTNKTEFNTNDNTADNFIELDQVLTKGSSMNVILKCNGVWLINGNFGCTFRAEQVMVTTRQSTILRGFGFIQDDDDATSDTKPVDVVPEAPTNAVVDDSDNDESGEEYSQAFEPVPEPKKKVRRVKKSSA